MKTYGMNFYAKKISFILLSSVCFVSCGKKKPPAKTGNGAAIVDVMITQRTSVSNELEIIGTVISNQSVDLHPEVSGRITYLNIPEGKFVSKGTLLVRLNDADLEAQLAKSKVQLDLAQKTVDRYKQLLAVSGINQSDYDAALNTSQGYTADIEYEQALIDKTFLKAPFSGTVGLRQVSVGAYVSLTDVIATMQEMDELKIDFTIPEQYSDVIKKGKTVDVLLNDGSSKKLKATIIATEPQINQNTRNLLVRAVLPGKTKANVGSFAKVYIDAGDDKQAILIPTNSLIPEDISNQVVLVKNGKAAFVNVETGVRQSNNVEITNGLKAGDTVIVTGVLFAKAKAPVKVRSVKTLAQLSDSTVKQINN